MRPNYLTVDDVITEEEIATIHEKMSPKLTRAKSAIRKTSGSDEAELLGCKRRRTR